MTQVSFARGPEAPVLDITIGDMIAGMAACFPDRDALISRHQDVRLSWSEFDQEIDRTARGLAGLDLKPLDRIGVWSANCVELLVLQMACARAGFILVSINPSYGSEQLGYVLRKSRIKALFLWDHDTRHNYAQILHDACKDDDIEIDHLIWMGTNSWMRMLTNAKVPAEQEQFSTDPVAVHYTSGTTGKPKGVLLSHRDLINNAWHASAWLGITEEDRVCNPCSLAHYAGSIVNSLSALIRGAAVILPSPQFDARAALESIHEERATVLGGLPSMYLAQLEHPDFARFDTGSLRVAWVGGAPCPSDVLLRAKKEMGIRSLLVLYGQTESGALIALRHPSESFDTHIGSVMSNAEINIVDPSTGTTVPIGIPGELCTRGIIMSAYDDPEMTSRSIDSQGWLHTGDLAVLHSSGHFEIIGRLPDNLAKDLPHAKPPARDERNTKAAAATAAQ